MSEKKVILNWEKFDPWKNVFTQNGKEDYGVYQITGSHAVFGDGSLLYIGRATDQSFSGRFKQHEDWLLKEYGVKIYVGRTTNIENDIWDEIIKDVEALLIFYHSPPYNSKSISEYPTPKRKLRIINTGDYGSLYPEISHEALELENLPSRPKDE